MDGKVGGLVKLIDEAISIVEERLIHYQANKNDDSPEALKRIISGLHYVKGEAISGRLYPSEGRNTLGIARNIAEYDRFDSPLSKKAGEIERYYQDNL